VATATRCTPRSWCFSRIAVEDEKGELLSELTRRKRPSCWRSNRLSADTRLYLRTRSKQRGSVQRASNHRNSAALLIELFTHEGSGT